MSTASSDSGSLRVQADLARGDLGSARRRLASSVGSGTYNPELLGKIAEISEPMSDPVQAGRYWLLTPATGPEVEAAIEAFARQCHHDGRTMAWELPRFRGRVKVAEYPEVVRERLARYGIAAVFEAEDPDLAPKGSVRQGLLPLLGCLGGAVALVLLIFFVLRALARALNWCGCR